MGKPVGSLFDGWVYLPKSGWIYTSPKIYPYAFSQNDGWLKYELGTDPRRVFYFKEDAWKVLNKKKRIRMNNLLKSNSENIVLFIIAILVVAICVYTPNNNNNISFDKGLTPL